MYYYPEKLSPRDRNIRLYDTSHIYYDQIEQAIRKYDPNHLILGDKYNGNRGVPNTVVAAMEIFMDVYSVKYVVKNDEEFREMISELDKTYEKIEKPILLADFKIDINNKKLAASKYLEYIDELKTKKWFLGYFYNGFIDNPFRDWSLKDASDSPVPELIEAFKSINGK